MSSPLLHGSTKVKVYEHEAYSEVSSTVAVMVIVYSPAGTSVGLAVLFKVTLPEALSYSLFVVSVIPHKSHGLDTSGALCEHVNVDDIGQLFASDVLKVGAKVMSWPS